MSRVPPASYAPLGAVLALVPLLAACRGPRVPSRPLVPEAVLAEVKRLREAPRENGVSLLSLEEAAARLRTRDPSVRDARARWRTEQALADVPTPLANPAIGAGPLLLGGPALTRIADVGFELGLGWAIQLTPKRALQDDLNAVTAAAAFTNAVAVEREAYLALRREQVRAVFAAKLRDAHLGLEDTARETARLMERAVQAGETSEIDASLLRLEADEFETEGIVLERDRDDVLDRWRARLALGTDARPDPSEVPALPEAVPPEDDLGRLVVRDHPELSRLRAEYVVAEKALRLEAARAVPDLAFEPAVEDEVEVQKLGLPLGIEIPLFDRNQGPIARACAHRDEVRERYAAALDRALSEVARARRRILHQRRILARYDHQHEMGMTMADQAERALEAAGGVDLARYLEILRTGRRVEVDRLLARADLYDAWLDLEGACGAPLLRFRPLAPPSNDDLAETSR